MDTRSRYSLFKNGRKTETSLKIEEVLHVRLGVNYQNIVCRTCFGLVKSTEKKQGEADSQLRDLQQKFSATCTATHNKYGSVGQKRQYISSPQQSTRPLITRSPTKIPVPSPRKSPPHKKKIVDLSSPVKSKIPLPPAKKKLFLSMENIPVVRYLIILFGN